MAMKARRIGTTRDLVGESPRWDHRAGVLVWVDAERPVFHTFAPKTRRVRSVATSRVVSSIGLADTGLYVGTAADGIRTIDPNRVGAVGELVASIEPPNGTVPNDSGVDPRGRLFVGFGSETERGLGLVIAAAPTPRTVLEELALPNGIAWSPDGATMYVVDSYERVVHAIEYDPISGSLGASRALLTSAAGELPDGLAVDAVGDLWVAFWGGGCVRRYASTGELTAVVHVPTPNVASCAFGGPRMTDLYVTTASYGTDDPLGGALFVVESAGRGDESSMVDTEALRGAPACPSIP